MAVLMSSLGTFPAGDVVAIDHSLAAMALISATTCSAGDASAPVPSVLPPKIVHHDLRAVLGEHQRVLTPDASTCTGDDGDSTFTQPAHLRSSATRRG